jgi:hypothetical protein
MNIYLPLYLLFGWLLVLAKWTTPKPESKPRTITGQVLSGKTHAPVPSVMVWCGRYQGLTNDQGRFTLTLPRHDSAGQDTLQVKTHYYVGKASVPANPISKVTIYLSRNSYRFSSGTCTPTADSVHIRPYAPQIVDELRFPGSQYAFFFENTLHRPLGRLRTISFDLTRFRHFYAPFRLRIYQIDSTRQAPKADLLTENVALVLCPTRKAEGESRTMTFDISSAEIPVPAQGFYLALEGLQNGDHFYPCDSEEYPLLGNSYRPTGPALHPPCSFANTRTWTWYHSRPKWQLIPAAQNCWPLYEDAIRVEADGITN